MQQIHHKKNKQGIIEFTNSFESQYLYLEKLDAEVLFELSMRVNNNTVFIPSPCTISGTTLHYIRECWQDNCPDSSFVFLDDTTPNLSKYTPKDNAVLFLSEEDKNKHKDKFQKSCVFLFDDLKNTKYIRSDYCGRCDVIEGIADDYRCDCDELYCGYIEYEKITIFLSHGTQSELQKAEEVAKELKEKYGVEEVNLFVLHLFVFSKQVQQDFSACEGLYSSGYIEYTDSLIVEKHELNIDGYYATKSTLHKKYQHINNFITTNSINHIFQNTTSYRLDDEQFLEIQVIDCKEIFEEYLKENN
jgi:hypothetical protein